jgi:hypothetical protein
MAVGDWDALLPSVGTRGTIKKLVTECLVGAVTAAAAGATHGEVADAATPFKRAQEDKEGRHGRRGDAPDAAATPTALPAPQSHALMKGSSLVTQGASAPPRAEKKTAAAAAESVKVGDVPSQHVELGDDELLGSTRVACNRHFWKNSHLVHAVTEEAGKMDQGPIRPLQADMAALFLEPDLTGNDLFVKAATGAGKTDFVVRLAFASSSFKRTVRGARMIGQTGAQKDFNRLVVVLVVPFVVNADSVLASLGPRWQKAHAGSAGGATSAKGDFQAFTREAAPDGMPGCCLFVATPESLKNHRNTLGPCLEAEKAAGGHVLFVLDEADAYIIDDGFRYFAPVLEIAESMSDQILWMSATGSKATIDALKARLHNVTDYIELGPQGLAARPDVDYRVVHFGLKETRHLEEDRADLVVEEIVRGRTTFRHRVVVYVRKMRTDTGETHKEVVYLREKLEAKGFNVVLLHAKLGEQEKQKALRQLANGNTVMLVTELIARYNVLDVHLVVVPVLPTSVEMFVQLAGRTNRCPSQATKDSGVDRGEVVVFHRPEDAEKHFDFFVRTTERDLKEGKPVTNGSAKIEAMKVGSDSHLFSSLILCVLRSSRARLSHLGFIGSPKRPRDVPHERAAFSGDWPWQGISRMPMSGLHGSGPSSAQL